ncbi:hypothetical protein CHLRE_09g397350v5 [Chlamydomonas reinhardtii]|uniref:Regulator of telomere elongation helicase 1 homolog n=1 Tax=Chlamydomonas reinhardtii TaxID=3055 RepID=A0A2K3DD36_CHLRE|nr:uncharacterized protein CHLRE_09g397350v5 [Chlamydomonas reinhardtii]PNW78438.1 hypothetical protein CHLRE_09g397350v5 [Chlamydomonas reinhardtii]
MPQYSIRGHEVHFPHQPYGVQLSFMEKMLRTLDEQGNALLEAPTGCGKTLSLLCAALAWQAKRKRELQERAAARLRRQVEGGGSGDGPGPSTHSAAPEAAAGGSGGSRGRERRSHRDKAGGKAPGKGAHGNADDSMSEDDDDATDFEPNAAGAEGADIKKGSRKPGGSDLKHQDAAAGAQEEQGAGAGAAEEDEEGEPPKLPRIFFATRTHSQIAQVVRELKRTAYKPSMAILAAKQHYCINKAVLRTGRVDEECERLAREEAFPCRFRNKGGGKQPMRVAVAAQVHDIEELSSACAKAKTCPYFTARDLALTAELVFCPYSYLLDPVVRAALGLDVGSSVLIFDEAHNMEDVCREGGSMDLDLDALREVEAALRLAAALTGRPEIYEPLAEGCNRLVLWLARYEERPDGMAASGFEEHEAVWQGPRALTALDEMGLSSHMVAELWRAYEQAKAFEEKATFTTEGDAANEAVPANVRRPGVGGGALGIVGRLLTVLRLLYAPAPPPPQPLQPRHGAHMHPHASGQPHHHHHQQQQQQQRQRYPGQPHPGAAAGPCPGGAGAAGGGAAGALAAGGGFIPSGPSPTGGGPAGPGGGAPRMPLPPPPGPLQRDNSGDYRVVVKRWIAHGAKDRRKARSRLRGAAGDDEAAAAAAPGPGAAVSLSLWCFNPAVAFRHLADKAHSVVLTSGTLAPLDSFASELGTEFHVRLEAPHVVDMGRQVWAGVVPRGPGGGVLSSTFKEAATFRFQDEAGEAVLRYCQVIPDGVLMFVPSYGLLDKLVTRWKATGLWSRLEGCKTLVTEGREAGKGFEDAMSRYYAAVRSGRGGLFMAICRGKASEGIDFADQHARGVILLGIPFPAVKDTKVRLKKEYNDAGSGPTSGRPPSQRLLSGDAWYSQQAFRALNQAVGRCIRHKYDWGAIILLDERFRGPGRQQQLSRWVRAAVKVHESFDASVADLSAFYRSLTADPPRPPPPPPVEDAPASDAKGVAASSAAAGKAGAAGSGKAGVKGGKGGKPGIELRYEEDVITPGGPRGGGTGKGSGAAVAPGCRPFEQFRMAAGGGVAAGGQVGAEAAPGGGAGAATAGGGGTSRPITSYFGQVAPAPAAGQTVVAAAGAVDGPALGVPASCGGSGADASCSEASGPAGGTPANLWGRHSGHTPPLPQQKPWQQQRQQQSWQAAPHHGSAGLVAQQPTQQYHAPPPGQPQQLQPPQPQPHSWQGQLPPPQQAQAGPGAAAGPPPPQHQGWQRQPTQWRSHPPPPPQQQQQQPWSDASATAPPPTHSWLPHQQRHQPQQQHQHALQPLPQQPQPHQPATSSRGGWSQAPGLQAQPQGPQAQQPQQPQQPPVCMGPPGTWHAPSTRGGMMHGSWQPAPQQHQQHQQWPQQQQAPQQPHPSPLQHQAGAAAAVAGRSPLPGGLDYARVVSPAPPSAGRRSLEPPPASPLCAQVPPQVSPLPHGSTPPPVQHWQPQLLGPQRQQQGQRQQQIGSCLPPAHVQRAAQQLAATTSPPRTFEPAGQQSGNAAGPIQHPASARHATPAASGAWQQPNASHPHALHYQYLDTHQQQPHHQHAGPPPQPQGGLRGPGTGGQPQGPSGGQPLQQQPLQQQQQQQQQQPSGGGGGWSGQVREHHPPQHWQQAPGSSGAPAAAQLHPQHQYQHQLPPQSLSGCGWNAPPPAGLAGPAQPLQCRDPNVPPQQPYAGNTSGQHGGAWRGGGPASAQPVPGPASVWVAKPGAGGGSDAPAVAGKAGGAVTTAAGVAKTPVVPQGRPVKRYTSNRLREAADKRSRLQERSGGEASAPVGPQGQRRPSAGVHAGAGARAGDAWDADDDDDFV